MLWLSKVILVLSKNVIENEIFFIVQVKKRGLIFIVYIFFSLFSVCIKVLILQYVLRYVENFLIEIRKRIVNQDLEMNVIIYNVVIQVLVICGNFFYVFDIY